MKPATHILNTKRVPDCNIIVGVNETLIRFVEGRTAPSQHVKEVTDDLLRPGVSLRVDTQSGLKVVEEKLLSKTGVWDCSGSLDPGSALVKDIIDEACRIVDVKLDKDVWLSHQWKLFEGNGGIVDVERSILEATQWVQLPPDPKPALPWFDPEGWFRLAQVRREIDGYQAYLNGDQEKMTQLGVKENRISKWALPVELVAKTVAIMDKWAKGSYTDEITRMLLRITWKGRNNKPVRRK